MFWLCAGFMLQGSLWSLSEEQWVVTLSICVDQISTNPLFPWGSWLPGKGKLTWFTWKSPILNGKKHLPNHDCFWFHVTFQGEPRECFFFIRGVEFISSFTPVCFSLDLSNLKLGRKTLRLTLPNKKNIPPSTPPPPKKKNFDFGNNYIMKPWIEQKKHKHKNIQ